MARNLYRFYLYAIYIVLLIFGTMTLARLLATLLAFTPLGSPEARPAQADIVQSIVLAVISLVIVSALGGLHYWLIRRDIRHDPAAGGSAIRSFFLNITEAIGIACAVPMIGFMVIGQTGTYVVEVASYAILTLVLVAVLETERRRTEVTGGAALAFQRLHFYAVQIILLIFLTSSWLSNLRPLIDGLFFAGKGTFATCNPGEYCPDYNLPGLAGSVLWFIAAWISYGWLVKNDRSPFLRLILHGVSFAYGVSLFVLSGLYSAFKLIILPFFHITISLKDVLGTYAMYDFVPPLTLGILITGIYHWWLYVAARQGLIERRALFLTECAIIAIVAAASFWWGCGNILYHAMQRLVSAPNGPDAHSWVSALAFMLAGAGYFGLDLYLHRRHVVEPSSAAGPRRGLVFALLGGGILAFAIGGASALYAWVTALLGSPISDWQQASRAGLATFIVGLFLVGIYLWSAMREKLFSNPGQQRPAPAPVTVVPPVQPVTVEEVLDELLAGNVTREEAASRIRTMQNALPETPD
jgi:hypothetical protein